MLCDAGDSARETRCDRSREAWLASLPLPAVGVSSAETTLASPNGFSATAESSDTAEACRRAEVDPLCNRGRR